ncbi:MAG TPA: hypothetical protein VK206_10280 [Anaerolineales bacterium]|nr:hypothetical protein [Anaerolineales bacterium]
MKKKLILILLVILCASCTHNIVGNSIVIGSSRESILLGSSKIYAIDETGVEVSISPPFSDASNAQWSPNRQWIVYQTQDINSQLIIVKSDSSQKFTLTNNSYPCGLEPTWSPNGKQIAAYFCASDRQDGIYAVDVSCIAEGQDCMFDHHFIVEGRMPSWSSDGKQLTFWRAGNQVFVDSIASPDNMKMVSPKDRDCYESAWSPLGDEIAMRCFVPYQGNNIFLVNSDGSNSRNITNNKSQDALPTWSPDGTKIVFVSDRDPNLGKNIGNEVSSNAVYIMNSDGTDVKRISPYDNERILWIDWVNP